jgi:hypothetical protein
MKIRESHLYDGIHCKVLETQKNYDPIFEGVIGKTLPETGLSPVVMSDVSKYRKLLETK